MQQISFPVITHQGHFEVGYDSNGSAWLNVIGMRMDGQDLSPAQKLEGHLLAHWQHDQDLARDLADYGNDEALEKYRSLFIERDIKQTDLEPPNEAGIARLEIPLTLWNDTTVRLVFRADGRGFIIDRFTTEYISASTGTGIDDPAMNQAHQDGHPRSAPGIVLEGETLVTTFAAAFPTHSFSHDLPPEQIIEDRHSYTVERPVNDDADRRRIESFYVDLFWTRINPSFKNQFIHNAEQMNGQRIAFRRGDRATLETLIVASVQATETEWDGKSLYCVVGAAAQRHPPYVSAYLADNDRIQMAAVRLIEKICLWAYPSGYQVTADGDLSYIKTWNDCVIYPDQIGVKIPEPSASQRMEALERLLDWAEREGIDVSDELPV